MLSEGANRQVQSMLLHIDENDDFGIMLATAQCDTIGAVTIKPIWFASLAGLTNANGGSDFKYSNLSYEECAGIIRKYVKAAPVEILKFFRIVVFNYLTLNDDAHLKNFSLINRGDGEYHLANT